MTARTLRFEDKERKTIALHALAFYKVKKKMRDLKSSSGGLFLQPYFFVPACFIARESTPEFIDQRPTVMVYPARDETSRPAGR